VRYIARCSCKSFFCHNPRCRIFYHWMLVTATHDGAVRYPWMAVFGDAGVLARRGSRCITAQVRRAINGFPASCPMEQVDMQCVALVEGLGCMHEMMRDALSSIARASHTNGWRSDPSATMRLRPKAPSSSREEHRLRPEAPCSISAKMRSSNNITQQ